MGPLTNFVEGPLLWLAWGVFIIGSIIRLVLFFTEANKKDKAVFRYFNLGYVLKTWIRYLLPFNQTVAKSPVFSILGYIFHFFLIVVPIFIIAHIDYWAEGYFEWDWSGLALPDEWVPWLTWVVIIIGILFLLRRIFVPEVRILSSAPDFILVIVTILPFLTGFLAAHTGFMSGSMYTIHVMSGELMLILIPLTKLSHFILFFPSRMVIGIEWGRRGYSA